MASTKWQEEVGFLELFLAYFERYQHSLARGKRYRDFLLDILLCHERVIHHCGLTIDANPISVPRDGMPVLEAQVIVVDNATSPVANLGNEENQHNAFPSPSPAAIFSLEVPFKGNTSEDEKHGVNVKNESLVQTSSDLDVETEVEDCDMQPPPAMRIKMEGELVLSDSPANKWEPCEMVAFLASDDDARKDKEPSMLQEESNEPRDAQYSLQNGDVSNNGVDGQQGAKKQQENHPVEEADSAEEQQIPEELTPEQPQQQQQQYQLQRSEIQLQVFRHVQKRLQEQQQQLQRQQLQVEDSARLAGGLGVLPGTGTAQNATGRGEKQPEMSSQQSQQFASPPQIASQLPLQRKQQQQSRKRKRPDDNPGLVSGSTARRPAACDTRTSNGATPAAAATTASESSFLQLPLVSPRKEPEPMDINLQPSLFERMALLPPISPPVMDFRPPTSVAFTMPAFAADVLPTRFPLTSPPSNTQPIHQSGLCLPDPCRPLHFGHRSPGGRSVFNIAGSQGRTVHNSFLQRQSDAGSSSNLPAPTKNLDAQTAPDVFNRPRAPHVMPGQPVSSLLQREAIPTATITSLPAPASNLDSPNIFNRSRAPNFMPGQPISSLLQREPITSSAVTSLPAPNNILLDSQTASAIFNRSRAPNVMPEQPVSGLLQREPISTATMISLTAPNSVPDSRTASSTIGRPRVVNSLPTRRIPVTFVSEQPVSSSLLQRESGRGAVIPGQAAPRNVLAGQPPNTLTSQSASNVLLGQSVAGNLQRVSDAGVTLPLLTTTSTVLTTQALPNILTRQRALNLLLGQAVSNRTDSVQKTQSNTRGGPTTRSHVYAGNSNDLFGGQTDRNKLYGRGTAESQFGQTANINTEGGVTNESHDGTTAPNNGRSCPGTPSTCPAEDDCPMSPSLPASPPASRPSAVVAVAAANSEVFTFTEEDNISLQSLFRCSFCECVFFSYEAFARHDCEQARPDGDLQTFPCRLCCRSFKRQQDRSRHERSHSRRQEHICACCQRRFAKSADLMAHTKQANCRRVLPSQ